MAIFREEIEAERALLMIKENIWRLNKSKSVKCYMLREIMTPRTGHVHSFSVFLFHKATSFVETLGRVAGEAGILSEFTSMDIWQRNKLQRISMPWLLEEEEDDKAWKPSGLEKNSKICVFFYTLLAGLCFSLVVFMEEIVVKFMFVNRKKVFLFLTGWSVAIFLKLQRNLKVKIVRFVYHDYIVWIFHFTKKTRRQ